MGTTTTNPRRLRLRKLDLFAGFGYTPHPAQLLGGLFVRQTCRLGLRSVRFGFNCFVLSPRFCGCGIGKRLAPLSF